MASPSGERAPGGDWRNPKWRRIKVNRWILRNIPFGTDSRKLHCRKRVTSGKLYGRKGTRKTVDLRLLRHCSRPPWNPRSTILWWPARNSAYSNRSVGTWWRAECRVDSTRRSTVSLSLLNSLLGRPRRGELCHQTTWSSRPGRDLCGARRIRSYPSRVVGGRRISFRLHSSGSRCSTVWELCCCPRNGSTAPRKADMWVPSPWYPSPSSAVPSSVALVDDTWLQQWNRGDR